MRAREILLDFLQSPDNELKLKQQISALAAQIKPTALEEHQQQLTDIASKYPTPKGGKRLTRGHHLKKKWGTQRKLKQ
jgi:hypothetical protein